MFPKNETSLPVKSRRKSRWRRSGVMSTVARCSQDGTGRKHETLGVVTYSIVARDESTGQLGVAVQSHYFQVGPVVPWALAGVGAIATQSMVNVSYGPLGVEYMRLGYTAEQALKALLAGDSQPESRQVALIDASGGVAVHT